MAITPEQAMNAAREAAAPTVERITKLIDNQLGKYLGIGSVDIELPTKLKGKGTSKSTEVLAFMVEDAVKPYQEKTSSGSYWDVGMKSGVTRKNEDNGELEEYFLLTFTPIFPPPPSAPGPGNYLDR